MINPANAMSLKAKIRNIAKAKGISAQAVLQHYFFERFLERLSLSKYQDKFILKGGLLIAAMAGLHTRSTMDLDATICSIPLDEAHIKKVQFELLAYNAETILAEKWEKYRQEYIYAKGIAFKDTVKVLYELLNIQDEVLEK